MVQRLKPLTRPFLILIALLALASLALQPLFAGHVPWRGDGLLHLYRLAALENAFGLGNPYPRWLSDLAYGYGFPLFNYYAPLSYYLVLPFLWLGVSLPTALVFSFAGSIYLLTVSAYLWGKDLWGEWGGIGTAVALTYAPYTLYNLHHRSALGELWGLAWLVFVFWAVSRLLSQPRRRYFLLTAVGYAALLLSHNITALLGTPFLLAYIMVQGARNKEQSANPLSTRYSALVTALLLGLLLSAFFWLPALGEQSYVQIERLTNTADYAISANFLDPFELFGAPPKAEPLRANPDFPRSIHLFTPLAILVAWLALLRRPEESDAFFPRPLRVVVIDLLFFTLTAVFTLFMTLPASQFIWDFFPLLHFVQFPWRMLGLASLFFAQIFGFVLAFVFALITAKRSIFQAWIGVIVLLSLFVFAAMFSLFPSAPPPLPAGPLTTQDFTTFEQETGWLGLTSAGDYLPTAVSELPAPPASFQPQTTITLAENAPITLDQFYFPGWRVWVDGSPVDITTSEPHGRIQTTANFPAGTYRVEAQFGATPLRMVATAISVLALLGLVGWLAYTRYASRATAVQREPSRRQRQAQRLTASQLIPATLIATAVIMLSITLVKQIYYDHAPNYFVQTNTPLGRERANFDDQLRLLDYDLPRQATAVDDPIALTFYWQVINPELDEELSVGIHLLDENGLRYGQSDQMHPGGYPVTRWLPHEYAVDAHALTPLLGTPPGRYQLEAVVYERGTGENLPFVNEIGQPLGIAYPLGVIELAPPESFVPPETLQREATTAVNSEIIPGVELLGFDLATTDYDVGTQFPLTLFWHIAAPPTQTPNFTLYLTRPDGQHVWRNPITLFPPNQSTAPTLDWQGGQTGRDAYLLTIPAQADGEALTSGTYRLSINDTLLTELEITAPERVFDVPDLPNTLRYKIGQLATLHALNAVQSDEQLDITLWWQVDHFTNTNYVAFVQLLGEDGRVITQSDQIPSAYTRPTTSWLPGEFITDPHTLTLPPDLPPGEYRLLVGLYEPVSGERLGAVETVFSAE